MNIKNPIRELCFLNPIYRDAEGSFSSKKTGGFASGEKQSKIPIGDKHQLKSVKFSNGVNNNQGILLLTATFLLLLIATLGAGYLTLVNNQLMSAATAQKSTTAFYYSESGIAEAIQTLKDNYALGVTDWSTLSSPLVTETVFFNGTFQVELISSTIDTATIKSTGTITDFQRIIEVTLDKSIVAGEITQQGWQEV